MSRRRLLLAPAILLCLIAAVFATAWTGATFSDVTGNDPNTFSAAELNLYDDDLGVSRYQVTNMAPGQTDTRCIAVTYEGGAAVDIRMYTAGDTGALGDALAVTVTSGTGGSFADCAGFVPQATVFTGTMNGLLAAQHDFASGAVVWQTDLSPDSRTYRISVQMTSSDNSLQGQTSGPVDFIWEAQSLTASQWAAIASEPVAPQPLAPEPPTDVTASLQGEDLQVSFTAPTSEGTSPVTGYTATCLPGSGPALQATGPTSPLTLSAPVPGQTYTCTVTATSDDGTSAASAPSAPLLVPTEPPGTPTAVTAEYDGTDLVVSFTAPLDAGTSPVTGYTASCQPVSGTALQASGSVSPLTLSGPEVGETYSCTVTATSAHGASASSDPAPVFVPVPVEPLSISTAVDMTYLHGCAIDATGTPYCWGNNNSGEVGVPAATADELAPVPVTTNLRFAVITAGGAHSCGLEPDGTAHCWGSNSGSPLGTGTGSTHLPQAVLGDHTFTQVEAGQQHTCALDTEGRAWCWGTNTAGRLGDGTTTNRAAPTLVDTAVRFTTISAGNAHTCGVATDATAWCWGAAGDGRLGNGSTGGSFFRPVKVNGTSLYTDISAGETHTCAITTAGSGRCWGQQQYGKVGNGNTGFASVTSPAAVQNLTGITSITAGDGHTCATLDTGTGYCWGRGVGGSLGNGSTALIETGTPTLVVGGNTFSQVAAGYRVGCAATAVDTVMCWGNGANGQNGIGTGASTGTPTTIQLS